MKRTIAAAVTAMAIASATPAFAVDFILHKDFSIGATAANFYVTSTTPTQVDARLGNTVGVNASFLDRYIFAPDWIGTGSGSAVTNLQTQLAFGVPGLRIDAYNLTGALGTALVTAFNTDNYSDYSDNVDVITAFLSGSPAPVDSWIGSADGLDRQLSLVPLDPTNFYVISVSGAGSLPGSRYDGNLSATAVPEPTTWAMMLAGFGLIGFAMRRKSQSHPKVRFAF